MSLRGVVRTSLSVLLFAGQGCTASYVAERIPAGLAPASADRTWGYPVLPGQTRAALPVPVEKPSAAPASRTHEDDPLARQVGPPPIASLEPRNGALVGAALGAGAGLAVGRDFWGRPLSIGDRAANALFYGGVGAATGGLTGAFGRDPYALLWPIQTALCEGSLAPSAPLPAGRRATGPEPACTVDLLNVRVGRM